MRQAAIVVVAIAVSWAGAFGIAVGVQEWRGGETVAVTAPSRCHMWEEQLLAASQGGVTESYYDWAVEQIDAICQAEGLQSAFR